MHRFLVESGSIHDNEALLSKEESRHALLVLRLEKGASVEVFDGKGNSFPGVVGEAKDGRLVVKLEAQNKNRILPIQISLAFSVIKPDRMEWMIEKACELGVARIIPVISDRTVVHLSKERWQAKHERWQKIIRETCKQCGSSRLPNLDTPTPFKEIVKEIKTHDLALIPHLGEKSRALSQAMKKEAKSILLFIGPEGDFSPAEIKSAQNLGAVEVTLGPLVLRSETAALYALSVANSEYLCRLTI